MTQVNLSQRDINVLEKMRDPDYNPAANLVVDERLPRDPQITDPDTYDALSRRERDIISSIQKLELELSQSGAEDADEVASAAYMDCVTKLDALISEYPNYASARNNRAQVMRRLYGDLMLLSYTTGPNMPLITDPNHDEKLRASATALDDLDTSISLLTPAQFSSPMAPTAAKTLSSALTQRGAIYLQTGKLMSARALDIDPSRREASWDQHQFQEAASHDLALGGRYGNEIAKNLAVSVNPTAKLCGQIVREAMRKEYGPGIYSNEPEEQ